jgi:hypothetical protein
VSSCIAVTTLGLVALLLFDGAHTGKKTTSKSTQKSEITQCVSSCEKAQGIKASN